MQSRADTAGLPITMPDQRQIWDQWHEQHTHASHRTHADRARNSFLSALPHSERCTVLELGCGQGRDATMIASAGHVVYGLDHSAVALGRASWRAMTSRTSVRLMVHDYSTALPFSDRFFDGVFAHLTLHYFTDRETQRIFDDVLRVVRPGGVFYFTVRSVKDPLFGSGRKLNDNMFCRSGHLRRFFDNEFVTSLLADWTIKSLAEYDTADTTNPGHFIEGIAYRPLVIGQTLPSHYELAK